MYNYYFSEQILVMLRCCLSNTILEEAKDVDSRLTESELGRLALKISSKNIRDIGQMHLDYDPDKLDSIEDTRRGDKWFFMFEVFVNWTYRNKDNQRRVRFLEFLLTSKTVFHT